VGRYRQGFAARLMQLDQERLTKPFEVPSTDERAGA
jgi:hypothetical protein